MTQKLLGSLCILLAGGWGWMQERKVRRRRLQVISALAAALAEMSERVRQERMPLPALLERMQAHGTPESRLFFREVAEAVRSGERVQEAWISGVETLPLEEGDRMALQEAGTALSGDAEQVCRAFVRAEERLRQSLEQARELRPEQERRAMALWLSAAALTVIVLF